ncbi:MULTISPECIES: cytoplasmic protein [Shewanella]|jgi:uncharacterized membrane protein|uniref:Cytoplasmic protein n=1 Tax=Shewanella chilikensis TaxID=558541 RepID=A0A6G7LVR2_9GAMM|nr:MULTISPECIES: cytoplasmic protein [Shewanella]MBZ4678117.1 cytoplasmic protein [Shewanella sp.]MCA0948984.1 cytoplasmic protein [Shewanella chilikensis]MCE9853555.1 cytoplasmic protein [Shewanella chilikensis]MCL1153366.1 cytoplasmic protein [Shewanella chilikensis]MCL1160885.1 cytoplasmic protein [Shewanella chilikensis]
MTVSLNSQPLPVNMDTGAVGVKVAQLAKQQQEAEGEIALQLIQAATPAQEPAGPVGNIGHNINTTA